MLFDSKPTNCDVSLSPGMAIGAWAAKDKNLLQRSRGWPDNISRSVVMWDVLVTCEILRKHICNGYGHQRSSETLSLCGFNTCVYAYLPILESSQDSACLKQEFRNVGEIILRYKPRAKTSGVGWMSTGIRATVASSLRSPSLQAVPCAEEITLEHRPCEA